MVKSALYFVAGLLTACVGKSPRLDEHAGITGTGEGEVRVAPDLATVQIGVSRQDAQAQAAQAQVSQVLQRVLPALTGLGVPAAQIQTSQLDLFPVFAAQTPEGEPPRVTMYQAHSTVEVRLFQVGQVGQVVDAALQAGANQLSGVTFGLRDETSPRQQALRVAAQSARQRAQALADGLGVQLGAVLEAQEAGAPGPRPMFREAAASGGGTQVAPGLVAVSATVTVRFEVNRR